MFVIMCHETYLLALKFASHFKASVLQDIGSNLYYSLTKVYDQNSL